MARSSGVGGRRSCLCRIVASATATRSTWADWFCAPGRRRATPTSTSAYLLLDGDSPIGVFTGGSLIVGAAARTDLVAPERTEELARAQYHSLQRLMGVARSRRRLADPRRRELLLRTTGVRADQHRGPGASHQPTACGRRARTTFVARLLGSLGSFPTYFGCLSEANRRGPAVLPEPLTLSQLTVEQVQRLRDDGATVVDVRPIEEYATAHVPGSLSIELRSAFGTWLGWLLPEDAEVVVLRSSTRTPPRSSARQPKSATTSQGSSPGESRPGPVRTCDDLDGVGHTDHDDYVERVLDIRQDSEFAAGHVPGAEHSELGALSATATSFASGPMTVMCGHGERAMSAASVLERAGRADVSVLLGGPSGWAASHGVAPGVRPVTTAPTGHPRPVRLGLRANLAQFSLLVAVNALVGGMVGQERTVLPLLADQEFHLDAYTAALTFILAFGVAKAAHQLPRRHPVRPVRPQAGAGRGLARRAYPCRSC